MHRHRGVVASRPLAAGRSGARLMPRNRISMPTAPRRFLSSAPAKKPLVYMVAGEASGDELGGRVMYALKKIAPDKLRFAGVGGSRMAAEGIESLYPMESLSVMGFFEVFRRLFALKRRLTQTVNDIVSKKPDVLVTIDSKGFAAHLRARVYQAMGSETPRFVHYVGSTSAWFAKDKPEVFNEFMGVDYLLLLFPFEEELYPKTLTCTATGHPLLEDKELFADKPDRAQVLQSLNLPETTRLVGVFPGSRAQEVAMLLSPIDALVISRDPVIDGMKAYLTRHGWSNIPHTVVNRSGAVPLIKSCDAAVAASGTAVLELAACKVPMTVVYKTSGMTARYVRHILPTLKHVSLANILLSGQTGPTIVPELIQEACTPDNISNSLNTLLTSPEACAAQLERVPDIMKAITRPDNQRPSFIAAGAILDVIADKF